MVIDVSHHNGTIKWDVVSKTATQVFIKATQRHNWVDPLFIKNAIGANAAGFKAGYYHFAELRTHDVEMDAKRQADWFVDKIKQAPPALLPLTLDFEDTEITLNKNEALLFINTFFRQLVLNGYHDFMLYGGTSYLNDHLPANHNLGAIPLWIADYNEPIFVPVGWDKITLHQHTDKGTIAGIKGNVDLNKYV